MQQKNLLLPLALSAIQSQAALRDLVESLTDTTAAICLKSPRLLKRLRVTAFVVRAAVRLQQRKTPVVTAAATLVGSADLKKFMHEFLVSQPVCFRAAGSLASYRAAIIQEAIQVLRSHQSEILICH